MAAHKSVSAAERPLHVVHLALEWPRHGQAGGVARYVERLVHALAADAGIRQTVLTYGVRPEDLPASVDLENVPVPRSRVARYYESPLQAREALHRVQARTEVDVVHAHGDDWALRASPPVLRSLYGTSLQEALRGGSPVRRLNHLVMAALEVVSVRRAAGVTYIGQDSKRLARWARVGADYVPPVVVPARAGAPNPWGLAVDSRPTKASRAFLYIGPYSGRKNGRLAHQALDAARAIRPDVRAAVVGPLADKQNWPPWVEHFTAPSDQQVEELLAGAACLLSPSRYEGFGIPVFEALRAGTPVLALKSNPGARLVLTRFSELLADDERDFVERAVNTSWDSWPPERRLALQEEAGEVSRAASLDRLLHLYSTTSQRAVAL